MKSTAKPPQRNKKISRKLKIGIISGAASVFILLLFLQQLHVYRIVRKTGKRCEVFSTHRS